MTATPASTAQAAATVSEAVLERAARILCEHAGWDPDGNDADGRPDNESSAGWKNWFWFQTEAEAVLEIGMAEAAARERASTTPTEQTGTGWQPIGADTPAHVWLVTFRLGERMPSLAWLNRWRDGSEEWVAEDGATTVTHHSFAPPTHWYTSVPRPWPIPPVIDRNGEEG